MLSSLGTVSVILDLTIKAFEGGKWVLKKIAPINFKSQNILGDNNFKFPAEYYTFTCDKGKWQSLKFGKEKLLENNRLIHDKSKLINFYPGIVEKALRDNRIGIMPYEVISRNQDNIQLKKLNSNYLICSGLKSIYDETNKALVEHYRRMKITYEPSSLARVCKWDHNSITIEQVNYTEAASTNMIADLDITSTFNKCFLMEDASGISNNIRNYDMSFSSEPGTYPSFKQSSLANPIGVAGIALTTDNKIILSHRSRNVSSYGYKLGPSSSGYVNWFDTFDSTDKFKSILEKALMREISEELHVDLTKDVSILHPLGFYREFYRAGMPQAFYLFKLNITSEELINKLVDAGDFRESIGIFSFSINKEVFSKIISLLVNAKEIKNFDIGIEAQALLTALALHEEYLWS